MPAIKIELMTGRDEQSLMKIRDIVGDSLVETFQLPPNDRNLRLIEYQPGYFQMKQPYEMLIEISMFKGRTKDTKRKLFQTIVSRLESAGLTEKNKVLIIINEQPLENWGVRGGFPADEIDLGFKVDV